MLAVAPLTALILAIFVLRFGSLAPDSSPFIGIILPLAALVPLWFLTTTNLAAALSVLLVYLACLDGYLKLSLGGSAITGLRDVFILTLVIGLTARWLLSRKPSTLPPMLGIILAWVVVVLVNVLNPDTVSLQQGLVAAFRQHLEFVPLFFLGFVAMRSKAMLRGFLVLLVAAAAVNGVVSVVQSGLSPQELAGWGPGYEKKINGNKAEKLGTRTFGDDQGDSRVRPFGLGSDAGAGGVLCGLALTGLLALLQVRSDRRARLAAAVAAAALLAGIVTSQSRTVILASVIAVLAYIVVFGLNRGVARTAVTVAITGLALWGTVGFIGNTKGGGANRYEEIRPDKALSTAYNYRIGSFGDVPSYALKYPLGAGLGTVGPAAGATAAGSARSLELDANAEGQLNYVVVETGIPGLAVFITLMIAMLRRTLQFRRLRDPELRTLMAGCAGTIFFLFASGWSGAFSGVPPGSAILWFLAGTIAYWSSREDLLTPRRPRAPGGSTGRWVAPSPAPAPPVGSPPVPALA